MAKWSVSPESEGVKDSAFCRGKLLRAEELLGSLGTQGPSPGSSRSGVNGLWLVVSCSRNGEIGFWSHRDQRGHSPDRT